MDASHNGLLAEETDIGLLDNLLQLAVGTHLPGGIAVARLRHSTGQQESGPDGGAHVVEVGHDIGTLRRDDVDLVV